MKKISKKLGYWGSVIAISAILGISLQFAKAWTEPGSTPPGGNLGAPINTSLIEQTKLGNLAVNGLGITGTGNVLLVPNGDVGIGTSVISPGLSLDVEGKVGAMEYCYENGGSCLSISNINPVLTGTWCGFRLSDAAGAEFECNGHDPITSCPAGYSSKMFAVMGEHGGNWYTCIKN